MGEGGGPKRTIDERGIATIRAALAERGVLFVRDQNLIPEEHIAFARRRGTIDVNNYFPATGGHPEIAEVREYPDSGMLYRGTAPPVRYASCGSHRIFYTRRQHGLLVIRILHQAMRTRGRLS